MGLSGRLTLPNHAGRGGSRTVSILRIQPRSIVSERRFRFRSKNSCCASGEQTYIGRVTFDWKPIFRCLACLAAAVLMVGCGGVNASHSVSPATMLIPGLIHAPIVEPSLDPAPIDLDHHIPGAGDQLAAS